MAESESHSVLSPIQLFATPLTVVLASLVTQRLKRLPAMWETQVQSLGWNIPWRRKWQPTPVFLPGEFHGGRSLVGNRQQGILQARILEWVALPFSKESSQARDRTQVSCIAGRFFTS